MGTKGSRRMKALTICQPYAELIARGAKRVENRRWPTDYRGPLAIHAGKSKEWLEVGDGLVDETYGIALAEMSFGAVVAIAELVACIHVDAIRSPLFVHPDVAWLKTHEHTEGPWCWVLDDVRRVDPIPASGQQRLWDFEPPADFSGGRLF